MDAQLIDGVAAMSLTMFSFRFSFRFVQSSPIPALVQQSDDVVRSVSGAWMFSALLWSPNSPLHTVPSQLNAVP